MEELIGVRRQALRDAALDGERYGPEESKAASRKALPPHSKFLMFSYPEGFFSSLLGAKAATELA